MDISNLAKKRLRQLESSPDNLITSLLNDKILSELGISNAVESVSKQNQIVRVKASSKIKSYLQLHQTEMLDFLNKNEEVMFKIKSII